MQPPATTKLFKNLTQTWHKPAPLTWVAPGTIGPGSKLPHRVPEGDLLINGVGAFEQYGKPIGHWFDGPGYVQRFSLRNDGSTHAYRRVDAPQNRAERALNRPVMGAMNTRVSGGALGNVLFGLRNPCNTNVIVTPDGEVQGRFEAYPPTRLDAATLQSQGAQHFGGALPAGAHLSAHPAQHADGSLWDFCLDLMTQTFSLYQIHGKDDARHHLDATMPYNGFVHDIVATRNHVVAILSPAVYPSPPTELPVRARRFIVQTAKTFTTQTPMDILKWEPSLGTYIGIFSLGEDKAVRWVKCPEPFFNFHMANAFETNDGSIVMDASIYDTAKFMWAAAHDMQHRAVNAEPARLARLTVTQAGAVDVKDTGHKLELTDTHATIRGIRSGIFCGLSYKNTVAGVPAVYDPSTNRLTTYPLLDHEYAATPIMLDDKLFATVVSSVVRNDSALHLYDASSSDTAPVARAQLCEQIPPTFHGTFVPGGRHRLNGR